MPDAAPISQPNIALQPKVEELTIDGKLTGTMSDIKTKLSEIPLYLISGDAGEINLVKIESRNISKRPYLFHIIKITPAAIIITYSYLPDSSLNLRRATILKNLSGILSLILDKYSIDMPKLLQYIDSVLDSLTSGLSQNYTTLYNRYDSMLTDYREIKRLNIELASSNRNLTIQSAQLSEDNKTMTYDISALRKLSDESLMALIEEWIEVHNNAIDLIEFGKAHDISPTRVEQMLDKMISLGYIELKT